VPTCAYLQHHASTRITQLYPTAHRVLKHGHLTAACASVCNAVQLPGRLCTAGDARSNM
jgi:hypothetical protein